MCKVALGRAYLHMTTMAWLPVLIWILSSELIIPKTESEDGGVPLSGHLV